MKPRHSFWSAALFLSLVATSAQAAGFERATAPARPMKAGGGGGEGEGGGGNIIGFNNRLVN